MKWNLPSRLGDEQFRRLTGVERGTFAQVRRILLRAHAAKKAKGGRPNKPSVPQMPLVTPEYLREHRARFRAGANYGACESTACDTIRWVEDTPARDGTFSLPGREELLRDGTDIEAKVTGR